MIELDDSDRGAIIDKIRKDASSDSWSEFWDRQDKKLTDHQIGNANYGWDLARQTLYADHKMFQPISLYRKAIEACVIVPSERCGAVVTDGKTIWINPTWWTERDHAELEFTFAFAALCLGSNYLSAMKREVNENGGSAWHWNVAANLIFNRLLIDDGVGRMPTCGAFITSVDTRDRGTSVETVYMQIKDMSPLEVQKMLYPLRNWDNFIDLGEFIEVPDEV